MSRYHGITKSAHPRTKSEPEGLEAKRWKLMISRLLTFAPGPRRQGTLHSNSRQYPSGGRCRKRNQLAGGLWRDEQRQAGRASSTGTIVPIGPQHYGQEEAPGCKVTLSLKLRWTTPAHRDEDSPAPIGSCVAWTSSLISPSRMMPFPGERASDETIGPRGSCETSVGGKCFSGVRTNRAAVASVCAEASQGVIPRQVTEPFEHAPKAPSNMRGKTAEASTFQPF